MRALAVKKTKQGKGVFAKRDFAPGEAILKLTGSKITYAQVIKKKNPDNPLQIKPGTYLDLKKPGLYFNHSCDPNCGLRPNLTLVSIKAIKAGEELFFDYSTTMDQYTQVEFICSCDTKSCRKHINGFKTLPARTKKRYLDYGIVLDFLVRENRGK